MSGIKASQPLLPSVSSPAPVPQAKPYPQPIPSSTAFAPPPFTHPFSCVVIALIELIIILLVEYKFMQSS